MSRVKKFLAIYAVTLMVLAGLWILIPNALPGLLPGDESFIVSDFTLFLPFGTAFITTATIALILSLFGRF